MSPNGATLAKDMVRDWSFTISLTGAVAQECVLDILRLKVLNFVGVVWYGADSHRC